MGLSCPVIRKIGDNQTALDDFERNFFQKEDKTFSDEFYAILSDYENRLDRATKNTILPDNPNMKKVEAFVEYVNRKAIEIKDSCEK